MGAVETDMNHHIPDSVLDRPVTGVNLSRGSLRAQLSLRRRTLLVFLRHFG
jgi:hypothetical protein